MWKPQSLPLKIPFVFKEEAWGIVSAKYREYQIALIHPVLETNLSFFNHWFKMRKLQKCENFPLPCTNLATNQRSAVLWQMWHMNLTSVPSSSTPVHAAPFWLHCSLGSLFKSYSSLEVPLSPGNLPQLTGLEGAFPPLKSGTYIRISQLTFSHFPG